MSMALRRLITLAVFAMLATASLALPLDEADSTPTSTSVKDASPVPDSESKNTTAREKSNSSHAKAEVRGGISGGPSNDGGETGFDLASKWNSNEPDSRKLAGW
ncbi:hypothetical protein IWQ62_000746 [Dispira parvispora]|uniref:Uncharacterized protein n=1 Tax=Dispira parvispora TaxID=1520584 RepID=A0A9W8AZZ2_9FUNG|nr:hypothetical protein IWQ62_000746 [Dispira parvispora]